MEDSVMLMSSLKIRSVLSASSLMDRSKSWTEPRLTCHRLWSLVGPPERVSLRQTKCFFGFGFVSQSYGAYVKRFHGACHPHAAYTCQNS